MRRIILGLTRFTEISVFGSDTTISFGSNTDRSRVRTELDADFLLVGAATASGNNISVSTTLVDAITGQYLWAERFDRKILPDGILGIGDDVANTVVRHLAQPFGIVFSRVLEREGPLPKHLASYDCVARYYHYCRQYDPEYLDTLIGDLEKAVSEDQRYSEAFACLSQAYSNAVRFNHDVSWTTNEPIRRALELADRAVELAPHSSLAFHARGLAYWYSGDTDACMKAFEHGRRLNPNDTDLMAELGHRYALLADWESAIPLLEESYQYNPGQSGVFRVGLSIYHHVAGRYERALTEAKKAGAPTLVYSFLLIAMSAAKLGRNDEAEAAVKKIREIDAHYGDHIVEDLTARHLHPDLIEIVVEGVRQAGLKASQVELAAARLTRR